MVKHLEVVRDGGVATVTFCRPPVNSLTQQVLRDFITVFDGFRDDRPVSAVVFRTCSQRAFIAGVDLKELAEEPADPAPASLVARGRDARDAFHAIHHCAVPVVAHVAGPVIGGGVCIVACCEIIVASDRATFGLTEINMGVLGASAHLIRMVGFYRAREMFLTGRMTSAVELAGAGSIARVVPPGEVDAVARDNGRTLAAKSPLALRLTKESMNRTEYLPFEEGYRVGQKYTNLLLNSEDSGEARQAFVEKREPHWKWQ